MPRPPIPLGPSRLRLQARSTHRWALTLECRPGAPKPHRPATGEDVLAWIDRQHHRKESHAGSSPSCVLRERQFDIAYHLGRMNVGASIAIRKSDITPLMHSDSATSNPKWTMGVKSENNSARKPHENTMTLKTIDLPE
jgi:hypothetical protein